MKYADQRNIPYVIIAGETEMNTNSFVIKNMKEGKQETVQNIINYFKK